MEAALETAPVEAPAPGVIASEPGITKVTKEAKEAPQPEKADLDTELAKVWDKANKPRSEDGKFAPVNPEAKEQKAKAPKEEVEPAAEIIEKDPKAIKQGDDFIEKDKDQPKTETDGPPEKAATEPPKSWSREQKEKWATLPPETQEYILQRDREAHDQISRLGREATAAKELNSVIEQYKPLFERNGIQPSQGIAALLDAQAMLDNPQTRLAAIAKICETYGVNLQQLAQVNPNTETLTIRAQLEATQRQLAEMRSLLQQQAQETQVKAQSSIEQDIQTFAKANPEWSLVEDRIVPFVQAAREQSPSASNQEVLRTAMEAAVLTVPELRQKRIEAEAAKRAEEAAKKAAAATGAASLNVKSNGSARPVKPSLDEALEATYARLHGRG